MTLRMAKASGRRVESGTLTNEQLMLESWKGVDIYTRHLSYFDKCRACIPDGAHMIYNTVSDMLGLLCNMGQTASSKVRNEYDNRLARSFVVLRQRRPWRVSSAREREMEDVLSGLRQLLPARWPSLKSVFARLADVGVADGLMCC